MTPAQLIAKKRDGDELSDAEISQFIVGFAREEIPDYQMSAMAMAIYFQGMNNRETACLTRAMLDSGSTLQWPTGDKPIADKHSTGGIGDKVSLLLAPMLACCGLQVPMLSGRGLGITGGTLDKLESIPGFRTNLESDEIVRLTQQVGCVITGASSELAPADRKLYALRDVTATVPSPPLIVASIMSKKLAEGLDSLVLDVKLGSGAFMRTLEQARSLAALLVDVGQQMGVKTVALITDMNQPLGQSIGNAIEVSEAIGMLSGQQGAADLLELTVRLGCELLQSTGITASEKDAHRMLVQTVRSGRALDKFREMVMAQNGNLASFQNPVHATPLISSQAGYLQSIDNQWLGNAIIHMGGGRRFVSDKIDHGVGIRVLVRVGDSIEIGQPIANIYSRKDANSLNLESAFTIGDEPVEKLQLVHDRIV